jgi:hypothetical protein
MFPKMHYITFSLYSFCSNQNIWLIQQEQYCFSCQRQESTLKLLLSFMHHKRKEAMAYFKLFSPL